MPNESDIATAFDATFLFLEAYWKLCGKPSNDIAVLLASLQRREDGLPIDIALWEEWKDAYRKAETRDYGDSALNAPGLR